MFVYIKEGSLDPSFFLGRLKKGTCQRQTGADPDSYRDGFNGFKRI